MPRSIELDEGLWSRLVKLAQAQGFSSPESYVADVLEKEVARNSDPVSDQQITEKMEELG